MEKWVAGQGSIMCMWMNICCMKEIACLYAARNGLEDRVIDDGESGHS